jgi:hypothetical protein
VLQDAVPHPSRWIARLVVSLLLVSLLVPRLVAGTTGPSLSLAPTSGIAGSTVQATGRGFPANVSGNKLMFGSTQVATVRTDSTGAFSTSFVVPGAAKAGGHVVSATVKKVTASTTFQVTAASPSPTPAPTPSPTLSPSPAPTASPEPSPSPSPSPRPAPSPEPSPSPSPSPAPSPEPSPSPSPAPSPSLDPMAGPDTLLIPRAELMALPTSGAAWELLVADAVGAWGSADASDQNSKHPRFVLAGALVATRTTDPALRQKVVSAIESWWTGPVSSRLLALARQVHGYVMAADLVGYRDPAFLDWLSEVRTRETGTHGRWRTLSFTAGNSANNYGTWSLASLIAIDAFIGDAEALARDWAIYRGYGLPFASGWSGGPFIATADWSERWSCVASDGTTRTPIGINTGCAPDRAGLDGAPVEDLSRSSSYPVPDATGAMYAWESVRAMTLQAILLHRAGFDAWNVNDSQLARLVGYLRRTPAEISIDGTLWGYDRYSHNGWPRWVLNRFLGTSYPVNRPADGDRAMGYSDWLWP